MENQQQQGQPQQPTDPQAPTPEQQFQSMLGETAQLEIQLRQLMSRIEQAPFQVNQMAAQEGFKSAWQGVLWLQRALQEHKIAQVNAQMEERARQAQAQADAQLTQVNQNQGRQPIQKPATDPLQYTGNGIIPPKH